MGRRRGGAERFFWFLSGKERGYRGGRTVARKMALEMSNIVQGLETRMSNLI
jgi:hypothetical protein